MGAFDWVRSTAAGMFGAPEAQPAIAAPQPATQSFLGTGGGPVDGIMSAMGHYADASFHWPWEDDNDDKPQAEPVRRGVRPTVDEVNKRTKEALERMKKERAETDAQIDAEAKNDPAFK